LLRKNIHYLFIHAFSLSVADVRAECPVSERKFSVCSYKRDSLDFNINNTVVYCFKKRVLDFCAICSTVSEKIMNSKSKLSQVFNNNPQGSRRLIGRSKERRWIAVQTDMLFFILETSERVISSSQRLYVTTQHSQQADVDAPVEFEPPISAGGRPQTYALDRAAIGTGYKDILIDE